MTYTGAPKAFPTLAVLTVTSGVMFTRTIDDVYQVLDHVLGTSLMTHELPEAGRTASPFILDKNPTLRIASINAKKIVPSKTDGENFEEKMGAVCNTLEVLLGDTVYLSFDQNARIAWDDKQDIRLFFTR